VSRKKKHEEHENHERRLVSYADFITLLFAFFVVMYSISSINEGKYKVLSESMAGAFKSSSRTLQPIQVGELVRSPHHPMETLMDAPSPINFKPIVIEQRFAIVTQPEEDQTESSGDWDQDGAASQVEQIASEVEQAMAGLIEQQLVSIRKSRLWLEVELNTSFLFASGSATPSIDAEAILMRLARVLKDHPNKLHVEGFTDDKPIQSPIFPSNWELSSARSAAVVRLFAQFGVDPLRMASVGYGEYKPIASNETESGRTKNRRVVIVIVADVRDEATAEEQSDSVTRFELLQQQLQALPARID
jgi:chemotaxis protein MotB